MTSDHDLVRRFVDARSGGDLVVLEGFHPLKHAVRFGADITDVVVLEGTSGDDLPAELSCVRVPPRSVSAGLFDRLVPSRPPVPVVALARRPVVEVAGVLESSDAPVVLLERPTHLGNLGAAIRVAAAADAAGVLVVGGGDPWHPQAVRGAAGLQFALPVARVDALPGRLQRAVVGFDPSGRSLDEVEVAPGAVLAFGTERGGLSDELRARCDQLVRIPMREGVSSLNLATAVAVALYAGRRERQPTASVARNANASDGSDAPSHG